MATRSFSNIRLGRSLIGLGALLALLAPTTMACVDNDASLFIRQVQARDPDSDCVVSADPAALFITTGVMDTSLTSTYTAVLLAGNGMHSRGDTDTIKTETSKVQIYEAEVELFDFGGATITAFTMPVSGFVDQAKGAEATYGLVGVTLVDPATGQGLASGGLGQTIVARIKLFGETLGGLEVETGYWDFPIYVCAGCMGCICPADADDDIAPVCSPGQNESIDCRLHSCWPNCGCPV